MGANAQRAIPAAILVVCLGMLAAALVFQYGLRLDPCILCLTERVPYAAAAVFAGLALLPRVPVAARRGLVAVCATAFLVNAGIGAYHVGVEQHWWTSATCAAEASGSGGTMTLADLDRALSKPAEVPCDRVQWTLFGISLAGYNLIASLVLATASAGAASRTTWWRENDAR